MKSRHAMLIFMGFLIGSSFWPVLALGQSVSLVPYYPETAFVQGRLLPFRVVGQGEVRIQGVDLGDGTNCQVVLDPHYPEVFHVFCLTAATVDVEVRLMIDGESTVLAGGILEIVSRQTLNGRGGNP